MITVGSLFSGIGGLDLGLERAGMEVRWQVENNEFCQRVLAKHWPDVARYGDIKELDGSELERVELLCGGFPCQPSSYAGKRRGDEDERWLWPEFARLIRVLRPRFVLMENVPGLFTLGFDEVIGDLADCGYHAEWSCIPAAAFGAPHLRYRVYLVAHTHCHGLREQSVAESWCHCSPLLVSHGAQRNVAYAAFDDGSSDGPSLDEQGATEQRKYRRSGRRVGTLGEWLPEPEMDRVAHGIPRRMVRPELEALGNAVVPQVAEWIGQRIMEHVA